MNVSGHGKNTLQSSTEWDETSDISTDELQTAAIDLSLLKFLSRHGILWLSRMCRVVWRKRRAGKRELLSPS